MTKTEYSCSYCGMWFKDIIKRDRHEEDCKIFMNDKKLKDYPRERRSD